MTKYEFLAAMQNTLSPLRVPERMEHCAFYEELINDMIEDGYTEEEATARLGDPAELAEGILQEEGVSFPEEYDLPDGPDPTGPIQGLKDALSGLGEMFRGKNFSFRWSSGQQDRFETQLQAEGIHSLDIRCISGNVEIAAEDRNTILLAEERDPQEPPMTVETQNGVLSISLPPQISIGTLSGEKSLTLILPETLAARLTSCGVTTVSGDVDIEDLKTTSLRVQTQSGDVDISDVRAAKAEVRTTSGDIDFSGSSTDLFVNSVSGDVDFSGAAGTVRINTVSGDMDLCYENCPSRLQVTSTSGDVDICLPPDSVCMVRFHSLSGELSMRGVRTDGPNPADFSIKTVSGDAEIYT